MYHYHRLMSRSVELIGGLCLTLLATAGCGGQSGDQETAPEPSTEQGAFGESAISGRVSFQGTPPTPARLRMESDPLCMPDGATSELLVVDDTGGVKNVFVHVTEGTTGTYVAPEEPVTLDQQGCRYIPHVFGVQVGQPLRILNSDPAVHNVNAVAKVNRGFNLIQQPESQPSSRMFEEPEVMVPIRCDVHPWMNSWAGVKPHPFFAVTADDGTFRIERLPPGTYTIEAWHEELGTETQTVTVDGTEAATADFTFTPQ